MTGQEFADVFPIANRKRYRIGREFVFTEKQCEEVSTKEEVLVPIRLDLEIDGTKIRDTFLWNQNDHVVSPDLFAEILCEDLKIPREQTLQFQNLISKQIKEQIEDFLNLNQSSVTVGSSHSKKRQRKNTNNISTPAMDSDISTSETPDNQFAFDLQDETFDDDKDRPELRILIKLDIIVGTVAYVDQIEWDINCRRNDPENFAKTICKDLNLSSEFENAIAHSIREQIHTYSKSLLLLDHKFDGSPIVDDEELAQSFLPTVNSIKKEMKLPLAPLLVEMDDSGMELIEKDLERLTRRKRRNQKSRRAITLPDREPQKTNRTRLPSMFEPIQEVKKPQLIEEMDEDNYFSGEEEVIRENTALTRAARGSRLTRATNVNETRIIDTNFKTNTKYDKI
ncbi:SWI/SNF chromatin-remodeling complex subunit [Lobulomyces angularis]|nr:SWI/SNF chromatin-remodeling complex subunit [Lobulomyces angularis]